MSLSLFLGVALSDTLPELPVMLERSVLSFAAGEATCTAVELRAAGDWAVICFEIFTTLFISVLSFDLL